MRQSNRAVGVCVTLAGDMKCLNSIVGKQGCSAMHFCPKCNVSKRSMVPGLPQTFSGAYLTAERVDQFEAAAATHEEVNGKKKTYLRLDRAPKPLTYVQAKVDYQTGKAMTTKKWVNSQEHDPSCMLPAGFNYDARVACMCLHITLGLVHRYYEIILAKVAEFDQSIKDSHMEVLAGHAEPHIPVATAGGVQACAPRHTLLGPDIYMCW